MAYYTRRSPPDHPAGKRRHLPLADQKRFKAQLLRYLRCGTYSESLTGPPARPIHQPENRYQRPPARPLRLDAVPITVIDGKNLWYSGRAHKRSALRG